MLVCAQEHVDVPPNLCFIDERNNSTVVVAKMGAGLLQPKALSIALNFVKNSDLIDGLVAPSPLCVRACVRAVRACVLSLPL